MGLGLGGRGGADLDAAASLAASFSCSISSFVRTKEAGDGGATGAASATSSTDSAFDAGSLFSLANSSLIDSAEILSIVLDALFT